MSGADRAIRVSTAAAVVGVAGIAAYVSYQHAYEVVRAHGETGLTARLEPATIDGLVYASSMAILYAARHRLPVPALARWLLALGIVATLAANVAHGWANGPVGAAVAAWPAASLVGSYELLLWLIRTAASGGAVRAPEAGHEVDVPGPQGTGLRLVATPAASEPAVTRAPGHHPYGPEGTVPANHPSGPARTIADQAGRTAGQCDGDAADHASEPDRSGSSEEEIVAEAVAAYRASVDGGEPLSERQLAAMFGKTSRRWARNRMAEARQAVAAGVAGTG